MISNFITSINDEYVMYGALILYALSFIIKFIVWVSLHYNGARGFDMYGTPTKKRWGVEKRS